MKTPSQTMPELVEKAKRGEPIVGVYRLTDDEYHSAECPGLSCTALKELIKSPAHYQAWLRRDKEEKKAHFEFGKAAHSAVLEPHTFKHRFAHYPDDGSCDGRSKAADGARLAFEEANPGKSILDIEDFETISILVEKVHSVSKAARLLTGFKEHAFFWVDPDTGVQCKCKPDVISIQGEHALVTDLKVMAADYSNRSGFARAVANYSYHVQSAFYYDGVLQTMLQMEERGTSLDIPTPSGFNFLVCEKVDPYSVSIYSLDDESFLKGRELYQKALGTYLECKREDRWPGYTTEVQEIRLPGWAWDA